MGRSHTSRDFDAELRELRAHSLAMGARCERSLQLALEAFWTGSKEMAAEVMSLDRQIDDDEMKIDALVLRVLSRKPTDAERTTWISYVQIASKTPRPTIMPPKRGGPGAGPLGRLGNKAPPIDARRAAYEDVMWALLNSSEFVFNH